MAGITPVMFFICGSMLIGLAGVGYCQPDQGNAVEVERYAHTADRYASRKWLPLSHALFNYYREIQIAGYVGFDFDIGDTEILALAVK
jgi:hypothetical protein